MAHEVFLCHSARDKPIADAACAALEARRISCWIAPRDVLAGEEWGKSIIEALSSANIVVLIFSGHANESPQVRREIERAVSKAKIIVPFRIENVLPSDAMEYALGNTHWLDAMSPPMEQCLTNLCQTISRLLERQHPLQPLWKPGDAVRSSETETAKAPHKSEPVLHEPDERALPQAVVVPAATDWHTVSHGSEAPSKQMVSGERFVSQPVIAATPPVPVAAVTAPPAPMPPAPATPPLAPPMPVQSRVPEVPAGTPAGRNAWIWGAGSAVIAAMAILAFAVPRLKKTDTPLTPPATSATVTSATADSTPASMPAPGPSPQPAPVIPAAPTPEAAVDQPTPTVDTPAAVLPKAAAAAPVKTPSSAPGRAVPNPPEVKKVSAVPNLQDLNKRYFEKEYATALPIAKDLCAAGTPRGCMLAGQMFEHGEGTTKDDSQAKTFYEKACDFREPRGCTNLALVDETNLNFREAAVFYRKGCDEGNPIGCTQLGVMYDRGQGVSQDYAQAAAAYRKGCEGKNLRACSNLGSLYLDGKGVAKDESQAMSLYRQACSGGYEPSCGHMKTHSP